MRIAALLFTLSLALTYTANAAQSLSTEVTSYGSSPVRIDNCRAALLDKLGPGGIVPALLLAKRNYYIDAVVDFSNIAPQTLNGVRFLFDVGMHSAP
jgi:hypothetical protein